MFEQVLLLKLGIMISPNLASSPPLCLWLIFQTASRSLGKEARQVLVGYKDAAFEASSPMRHATELGSILSSNADFHKSILFLYSDGSPDHRLTYMYTSVQVSLIALF